MKTVFAGLAAISMAAISQATTAADTDHGQNLEKEHCSSCHDDSMYTREKRRVTTLDGLQNQVRRCELNLGLKWFDDDINDVVTYLNNQYYKFE
jgi:cytochrome c553